MQFPPVPRLAGESLLPSSEAEGRTTHEGLDGFRDRGGGGVADSYVAGLAKCGVHGRPRPASGCLVARGNVCGCDDRPDRRLSTLRVDLPVSRRLSGLSGRDALRALSLRPSCRRRRDPRHLHARGIVAPDKIPDQAAPLPSPSVARMTVAPDSSAPFADAVIFPIREKVHEIGAARARSVVARASLAPLPRPRA
jgi:hypothetical protein